MSEYEVPLYMNGKAIGRISVNRDTGDFSGAFDPTLLPILQNGMDMNVKSMTFESIYGMFAHTKLSAQQRLAAYLEHEETVKKLEDKRCALIRPHYGHEWVSSMGKGPTYYCSGNVAGESEAEDDFYYTIREASGDMRVLMQNVRGLKNAKNEAQRNYLMTGSHIIWEQQSGWIRVGI